jgi:hypothetical protein
MLSMERWRRLDTWITSCAAFAAVAGCSGPQLVLGGGGDSGCVPGAYAGYYDCYSDASIQVPPGPIAFSLEGEPHGKTLHIASGATVGMDAGGIATIANISGTLDCTTYKLTGAVSNATIVSSSFTTTVNQAGDLSADYDASAPVPAFVNGLIAYGGGMLSFPLPGLPDAAAAAAAAAAFGFGAPTECSWGAQLQQ